MAVYLDSANRDTAREAAQLGFVYGVTTNPKLLAETGPGDATDIIAMLAGLFQGPIFYQLRSRTRAAMRQEAEAFLKIAPNVSLKVMCHLEGIAYAAEASRAVKVAVTGVFTPAQAYLAAQSGAHFIIPYVNRLSRFVGSGPRVIADMVRATAGTSCEILAAGIKSSTEALDTVLAGAHHLSLPLPVIKEMAHSAWTDQAMDDFDAASRA